MAKKAQAAMEFLLNYGWAILTVIIVIGALTYFGVLNPSNLASERCALSLPLKCLSQAAGDDGLIVTLQNTGNRDITLTSMTAQSDALQGTCMGNLNPTLTLRQGEKKTVSQGCVYQANSKTKSKYALSINYQPEGTTINLVSQGDAVITRQNALVASMCADAGSECQAGQGVFSYGSCKLLHDANPSLSTGVYTLSFGSVYCDMTTDGGGWTLAGRTGSSCNSDFGWNYQAGSLSDFNNCYSLGVGPTGISFTELLWGQKASGNTWGTYVYKAPVPSNFLTAYAGSMGPCQMPTPVAGGNSGASMQNCKGFTSQNTYFYLRDCCGLSSYGMYGTFFQSTYCTDQRSGWLCNSQAMLFVR